MVTESENLYTEHNKPKFFYGYIVVIAAFFMMVLMLGLLYSFGIFFNPLLDDFGWTRAETSGAFSLCWLIAGFFYIVSGKLTDLFGPRLVGVVCGFFLGLGYMLMSQVNSVWQVYLFYGVFIAIGISGAWPALTPTVARWFVKRRGLMTGLVTSGVGFGTLLISPVAERLIAVYDWRTSYVIIGGVVLVFTILAAQFLKRDPHQMGQLAFGETKVNKGSPITPAQGLSLQESIHTWQFWAFCVINLFFGFCQHIISVHIVPHITGVGISSADAAVVLAAIGGMNAISRIALGAMSDRIGVKLSFVFTFILMALAFFWLLVAKELWMFYVFALLFGFGWGGFSALQSLVTAELFGLSSLGVLIGTTSFAYTAGSAIGPVTAGYIFDTTGQYTYAFWASAIVSTISIIISLMLKPAAGKQVANKEISPIKA